MRKACATRLFHKGVDPQLIAEQTGHRSSAIMKYKKTDLRLKKQVSNMLNVLPIEMQEIRNSQERMLENENKHGGKVARKVPPSSTVSSDNLVKLKRNVSNVAKKVPPSSTVSSNNSVQLKENVSNIDVPQTDSKSQILFDEKKGVDLHVPINSSNLLNLRGLVQIHFHIYNK